MRKKVLFILLSIVCGFIYLPLEDRLNIIGSVPSQKFIFLIELMPIMALESIFSLIFFRKKFLKYFAIGLVVSISSLMIFLILNMYFGIGYM